MLVLGWSEAAVGGISWAVLVVMAMFGGGMIPLAAMDGVLAQLSHISIFRWTILALEGAVWRDYTLMEMLTPCGILLAIGVGGFVVGSVVYSRRS
jgi:ABC-2 type transport system permease protein